VSREVVELFHVHKDYAGDDAPALSDVTLQVNKGEFVFVTGRSGAGKSTLLKLVFCAEPVSRGQLLVFGRNVARLPPRDVPHLRRNIGVVFQDFKLLPGRTVAENVAFPLEVRGLPARDVRRRVSHALRAVGLEHRERRFPLSLSGGEQQRAAVARALVTEPALLLADEPTGNLDPERTVEVLDLLQAANARGTTVMVATHDRTILARYQKRVIQLEGGRMVSDGDSVRRAVNA
jgi:cell division transport system ATP-binding protein